MKHFLSSGRVTGYTEVAPKLGHFPIGDKPPGTWITVGSGPVTCVVIIIQRHTLPLTVAVFRCVPEGSEETGYEQLCARNGHTGFGSEPAGVLWRLELPGDDADDRGPTGGFAEEHPVYVEAIEGPDRSDDHHDDGAREPEGGGEERIDGDLRPG